MSPLDKVLEHIPAKQSGGSWVACCPAHPDSTPSLSIDEAQDGKVLLHCHAGCELDAILAAAELDATDLFPPSDKVNGNRSTVIATYHYTDEQNVLLYDVLRFAPKDFRQKPANGRKGPGAMKGVRLVLYRLRAVIEAVHNGEIIYIVEGEKDADRLTREGYCATTAAQGAGKWSTVADHARHVLTGAVVNVVQDKDDPGRKHARDIVNCLQHVATVTVLEAATGKDVSDHLDAGHTISELVEVVPDTDIEVVHADDIEVLDASMYFDQRDGLLHASLRADVMKEGPICAGLGGSLWRYEHGVWLPDGADEVRRRVSRLLGQKWRRSHGEGLVADLAAKHPHIDDDQPTQYINCANGLLHWETLVLHPHSPEVPSTYQLAVNWNPAAVCPTVDAWLAQCTPDDAIDLVWEIFGTAVFPDQPFHRAVLLLGPGRNGKGTLLRLLMKLIGKKHVAAVPLQALAENRFMAAELFGRVANISGDLDARAIKRTDLFKMATGGDLLTAERKNGHPFTFHNRATMLFSANEAPGSSDYTDGFFARWVVIPFTKLHLAPGTEDTTIEARLHAELEGVLVRAVDGLRRCMAQGRYSQPESVTEATAGFRENSDPLRRFIEDCITITDNYNDTTARADMYARYQSWCEHNGHKPFGANRFWGRLTAIDQRIDVARVSAGRRLVGGVRLVDGWL